MLRKCHRVHAAVGVPTRVAPIELELEGECRNHSVMQRHAWMISVDLGNTSIMCPTISIAKTLVQYERYIILYI